MKSDIDKLNETYYHGKGKTGLEGDMSSADEKSDKLLTVQEICNLLKVPKTYIYSLTHQRKIPHIKMHGHLRFRQSDIDEWLRSQEVCKIRNRWYVYITFPDGRRYRKSVGTKKQAERIEERIKAEVVQGKWDIFEMKEVSFSELATEYLDYARMNKASTSFKSDRCRIEGHLLLYFGDIPLKRITPQMVEDYKQLRLTEGASNNTVNHELTNLSHMLRLAIQWRYIDKNIVSNVQRMRVPEKPKRYLTQEEIQRLIVAAHGRCN